MANTRLSRTAGAPTLNTKYTISVWLKRAKLSGDGFILDGYVDASNRFKLSFQSASKLEIWNTDSGSNTFALNTNRTFRDTLGWYNIVLSVDTTDATAADRVKLYINGVRETSFSSTTDPSQNAANNVINESGATISIGDYYGGSNGFGGCMSHFHFIDGTAYDASAFGSTDTTTGEWEINTSPTVTYGNNGFFILKNDNVINDQSGNANNFTLSSGTLTKTEDCPSNVFATMNRASPTTAAFTAMGNGNLYNGSQSPNYWNATPGTVAASSGKFYWEVKIEGVWGSTSNTSQRHGIANLNVDLNQKVGSTGDVAWTDDPIAAGWQNSSGVRYSNSVTGTSDYPTYVVNDILMFAMDLDNLKLYLGKNGTWQNSGDPTSGASGTGAYTIPVAGIWTPYSETKYGSDTISWNCGNGHFKTTAISSAGTAASTPGIFEYDVPTSYQPMSTKGLNT